MEYTALINNFIAYILLTIFVMSLALIVINVLLWLNPKNDKDKRRKRIKKLGYFAFIIVFVMLAGFIVHNFYPGFTIQVDKDQITPILIYLSKIALRVFLVSVIVVFALFLALTIALFAVYGLWAICNMSTYLFNKDGNENSFEDDLKSKSEKLENVLKNPILIVIFTGGILAVFCIIPIIVGPGSEGLTVCWTKGIIQVIEKIDGKNYPFYKALSLYILIYISVLGIGFSILNIIYEIIQNMLNKDSDKGFWGEYSNSIGLIAVGVSLLLMITSDKFKLPEDGNWPELIMVALSSFMVVIVIIALGIISLEIVRLLLDMKETLIREQGRYVFFLLIGQCTTILILIFTMIYNAFRSLLTGNIIPDDEYSDSMEDITRVLLNRVAKDIKRKINKKYSYREKNNGKIIYNFFKKTTVKADEENIK